MPKLHIIGSGHGSYVLYSLSTCLKSLSYAENGMAQSTIINTGTSFFSNSQNANQGPKLVANQYVQGASLTLEPGNYVLYANCTFESDGGSGNRTIALRIGPSSTAGDFIYKVEPNSWNKEMLVSLVHIQTATTYSNYLYSSVASANGCANELKAIRL